MKRNWIAAVVISGALVMLPAGLRAQSDSGNGTRASQSGHANRQAPSVTEDNSEKSGKVSRKLLTSTVHEAWLASGRNEDKFFNMVKQLAEFSSDKRGVKLPDTEAAGQQMGNLIKENARRDPDQLLYAVVDMAVKQTAGTATASTR